MRNLQHVPGNGDGFTNVQHGRARTASGVVRPIRAPDQPCQATASTNIHLDHLAAQVAGNARFLAHSLLAIQREQGLTDTLLALVLAMPLDALATLRLCSKPRPEHWQADIAAIAATTHCDPERLSDLLLAHGAAPPLPWSGS